MTVDRALNPSDFETRLDIRMVSALAGDRALNAREEQSLNRLKEERGDALYADMLYTLTRHSFPARQAKHLWAEIVTHRGTLSGQLKRDPGIAIAAHDYLANVTGLLNTIAIIEERKLSAITDSATCDGLTGLIDHATFKYRLKEEIERQTRYGGIVSLVMLDIDHFKTVNDTHGHSAGDEVLTGLAQIIREQVRKMDSPARYGGEEFAIILPEVDAGATNIFAERLRQAVETHFASTEIPITISLGTATSTQDTLLSATKIVELADAALYQAKHEGRNKVCQAATAQQ